MRFYVKSIGLRLLGAVSATAGFVAIVVIGLQIEEGEQALGDAIVVLLPLIVVAVLLPVGILVAVGIWIAMQPSPPSWGAFTFGVAAVLISFLVLPLVVSPGLAAIATVLVLLLPWPHRSEALAPQLELQGP
ncbi:hypothetical protein MNBD_ACTINO01-1325 [hydrothermal vent metagenome]|uniref:Uncharacterized protein n=1 Tax=hydrothermal vent metagenome TaxID=652676 RepID=A0A3B0TBP5_9ZZZZ